MSLKKFVKLLMFFNLSLKFNFRKMLLKNIKKIFSKNKSSGMFSQTLELNKSKTKYQNLIQNKKIFSNKT